MSDGDLGGALAAMSEGASTGTEPAPSALGTVPAAAPSPSAPGPSTASTVPPVGSEPTDPIAGYLNAFDARLRLRKFTGQTVKKYRKHAREFTAFCAGRGWEVAAMPSDALATYLGEKVSHAARSTQKASVMLWLSTLADNGVAVAPQTVPAHLTANPKKRESSMAREVLPLAPPSALPSGVPASTSAGAAPQAPMPPSAPTMPAPAMLPNAAMPAAQMPGTGGPSRIPGVVTYRIYRQVGMGEAGGGAPGSWSMINDFSALDVGADVVSFVRNFLAQRFGPFPGGADVLYYVQSLDARGGHLRHLDQQVRIAAERSGFGGGFGGGAPGGFGQPQMQMGGYGTGGFGQPQFGQPQQGGAYSPEIQWIMQQHKETMARYQQEADALRKEMTEKGSKMDPMMLFFLTQKLDRLQPPADPTPKIEELMLRQRMGFGGFGGAPALGGLPAFDAYGQPVGVGAYPGALPAPMPPAVDPNAATMAELTKQAMAHTFEQKPQDPLAHIEAFARVQSLLKPDTGNNNVILEMLRDQAREAREEAAELRREVRELTANRKTAAESMGEFIALKEGMVKLGLARDVDDDGGDDSWKGVLRDFIGNAKEVGQGMREMIGAIRTPVTAADLAAEQAKRVAAAAAAKGGRAQLPAAGVSAGDAVAQAEARTRAEAASAAANAQAQAQQAGREAPPEAVITATEALQALPAEGDAGWDGVNTEFAIIQNVLGLVEALITSPTPKAQALGKRVQEMFGQIDSLAAMRNLISGVYVQLGATPELLNDLKFHDKIAKALHHHYPTIIVRLGGAERKPSDWEATWLARDSGESATPMAPPAPAPTQAPTPTPPAKVVQFPTKPSAVPAPPPNAAAAPTRTANGLLIDPPLQPGEPMPRDAYDLAVRASKIKNGEPVRAAAATAEAPAPAPITEEEEGEDEEGEEDEGDGEGEEESVEEGEEGEEAGEGEDEEEEVRP